MYDLSRKKAKEKLINFREELKKNFAKDRYYL